MRPAFLIVIFALLFCNQPAGAGPPYHGRVLRVKPGEVVVTIGTEEFEFVVTSRTHIELEGKPTRLESIRKGSPAVVEADRFGDVRIARRIVARKPHSRVQSP
jgi:multidrug resistance efflux pump